MADERTRYSDAELEEFKQLILKKLENARADYELLRATITHTADNDTEDTSPTFKVLEEGATTLSKEESGRLAAHQMKFIRNLEMALVRIENKTYGICKTTGKLIPKERLMKVPHATECIDATERRKSPGAAEGGGEARAEKQRVQGARAEKQGAEKQRVQGARAEKQGPRSKDPKTNPL